MILVDTSVWVNHFRGMDPHLSQLLIDGDVQCHPFVIEELACGNLSNRSEILNLLKELPFVPVVDHDEFMTFMEKQKLWGGGLGAIDVHLLACAKLAGIQLWTVDKRLKEIADEMGLGI